MESMKYLLIEPCAKSVYLNSYFHNKEYVLVYRQQPHFSRFIFTSKDDNDYDTVIGMLESECDFTSFDKGRKEDKENKSNYERYIFGWYGSEVYIIKKPFHADDWDYSNCDSNENYEDSSDEHIIKMMKIINENFDYSNSEELYSIINEHFGMVCGGTEDYSPDFYEDLEIWYDHEVQYKYLSNDYENGKWKQENPFIIFKNLI